jgi:hypothetical protein
MFFIMGNQKLFIVTTLALTFVTALFYLLHCLKKNRQLVALIGLFGMAMGFLLLLLDLTLIAFTIGPQYIPRYLVFDRMVTDTGFAGRWILTVYVFISAGPVISIYLLARNLISSFNKKQIG